MNKALSYLIVGNGKVAKHFTHYFSLKQIPTKNWSRKLNSHSELQEFSLEADVVLLLISDSAIETFINENSFLKEKTLVHFSGSLNSSLAYGAHPLMAFTDELYDLNLYENIPFIVDTPSQFIRLFPELKNSNFEIDPQLKGLYHAACVLGGNFSVLLWQKAIEVFQKKLALPPQVLKPYIAQVTKNILSQPEKALTGPLARRDIKTMQKNLDALKDDPYRNVYFAFIQSIAPDLAKELI